MDHLKDSTYVQISETRGREWQVEIGDDEGRPSLIIHGPSGGVAPKYPINMTSEECNALGSELLKISEKFKE